MKNFFGKIMWMAAITLLFTTCLVAQATTTDPAEVFDLVKAVESAIDTVGLNGSIYGAIVIIFGYLSKFIPGINKIPNAAYRVLAGGLVIGLIGVKFGLLENWQLILSFILSEKLYQYVLSLFVKSSEVDKIVSGPGN